MLNRGLTVNLTFSLLDPNSIFVENEHISYIHEIMYNQQTQLASNQSHQTYHSAPFQKRCVNREVIFSTRNDGENI